MSERQSTGRLEPLVAGSLAVWGLADRVCLVVQGDEARLTMPDGTIVQVVRSPRGWRVTSGEASSEHAGVPGMLRALRRALAPEQRPGRMIVAPTPRNE